MNKIFMIAKRKLTLYVVILMCASSLVIAEAPQKELEAEVGLTLEKERSHDKINQFTVETFATSEQDWALLKILEETHTFERIQKIINTNFNLSTPIRVHIQQPKEAQFLATELDKKSHVIFLPFSFLSTLYQGLSNKYEHQNSVIQDIFSASVEFFIWSEFAEILINNGKLEILGERFTAKDNFSSLMLLNQNNNISGFITDASEAYLLIQHTNMSTINYHSQSELELDQVRYKHIICLTMGFNQIMDKEAPENDHLENFSWDRNKIEQCKHKYLEILNNWYNAIASSLKEASLIKHWLHQSSSSKPSPLSVQQ